MNIIMFDHYGKSPGRRVFRATLSTHLIVQTNSISQLAGMRVKCLHTDTRNLHTRSARAACIQRLSAQYVCRELQIMNSVMKCTTGRARFRDRYVFAIAAASGVRFVGYLFNSPPVQVIPCQYSQRFFYIPI